MALLKIEDLKVAIGDNPILHGVSLALEAGQVLGVVGESGSGKSMTALAVLGLLPRGGQASGAIRFEGQNLARLSEVELCRIRGARIGMVFQEPMTALNPVMTIGDQVAEVVRLHQGGSRQQALTAARSDRASRVARASGRRRRPGRGCRDG
jgi:peptide/nickel transport system ATP-binding protein